jgi:hypothetical protein
MGNHDLYYKNTREVSLLYSLEKVFPKNIKIISSPTDIMLNGKKCLLQPWIIDEVVDYSSYDYVFGHFEIYSFMLSKHSVDTHSKLVPEHFKHNIKVYSGHYHLHHTKNNILYIGTPYPTSWNDFGNNNGFYILDTDYTEQFIPNTVSPKYIVLNVFGEREDAKYIEISNGHQSSFVDMKYFEKWVQNKNIVCKVFFEEGPDALLEEVLFNLKENNIPYVLVDNRTIKDLEKAKYDEVKDAKDTLLSYVDENYPEIKRLVLELLQ